MPPETPTPTPTPEPAPVATPAEPDGPPPTAEPSDVEEYDLNWLSDEDAEPKPAPEPDPEPAPEPVTEPPKPEQPTEQPPTQPALDPAAQQADLAAKRAAFLAEVTKEYENSLTPEDREAVGGEEPAKVFAKMAANLHLKVYESAVRTLFTQLPTAVLAFQGQQEAFRSAETKFFDAHPELRGHNETVGRIAKAYRQAYPDATMEQSIADIGAMSMQKLGLKKGTAGKPAARAKPNGHGREQTREELPPAPAGIGAAAPRKPAQANEFAELADWMEEDT